MHPVFGGEYLSRRVPLLVLLLSLLVVSRLYLSFNTQYTSDDAYITYRYAENIASGKGWVFNDGEQVQGNSSPLLTMVLAGFSTIAGRDAIPRASFIISLLADCSSLILLWFLLDSLTIFSRLVPCLLYALYPKVVLIGISGMEASIVVFLMIGSIWYLRQANHLGVFLFLALLLLTRIDGVLWSAMLFGWLILRKVKPSPLAPLLLLAMVGAWMLFAELYFGTWIPNSVIAKRVSWAHLFPPFDPVRVLIGYLPAQALEFLSDSAHILVSILLVLPPIVVIVYLWRRRNILSLFPLFFLLYNTAFAFGKVVMADWYYLPGYLSYFVTLALSLEIITQTFPSLFTNRSISTTAGVAFVFLLMLGNWLGGERWAENLGGLFERQNSSLGVWLRNNAAQDSRVLVEPIGQIGWESGLYIHDYIGLVSPDVVVARSKTPSSDRWFLDFVKEVQPDYIILHNWEIPENRLLHGHGDGIFFSSFDRDWFELTYHPVDWNQRAMRRDSTFLVLFERRRGPSFASEAFR